MIDWDEANRIYEYTCIYKSFKIHQKAEQNKILGQIKQYQIQ